MLVWVLSTRLGTEYSRVPEYYPSRDSSRVFHISNSVLLIQPTRCAVYQRRISKRTTGTGGRLRFTINLSLVTWLDGRWLFVVFLSSWFLPSVTVCCATAYSSLHGHGRLFLVNCKLKFLDLNVCRRLTGHWRLHAQRSNSF